MTRPGGGPRLLRPGTAGIRDVLVAALTVTTGAVDATAFLALGKVFSSVITGNLVLLGVAAGSGNAGEAIRAASRWADTALACSSARRSRHAAIPVARPGRQR